MLIISFTRKVRQNKRGCGVYFLGGFISKSVVKGVKLSPVLRHTERNQLSDK